LGEHCPCQLTAGSWRRFHWWLFPVRYFIMSGINLHKCRGM
jgi:hypothetical protein